MSMINVSVSFFLFFFLLFFFRYGVEVNTSERVHLFSSVHLARPILPTIGCEERIDSHCMQSSPFTPKFKKYILSTF